MSVQAAGVPTPSVAPSDRDRSLWQHPDFRKFWFGETVSLLGSQVTNLALPLTAISAFHASDAEVGVLRFLQLVPYIGLALVFGAWADRVRRRHVMIATNLVRMVLIGLVPVLAAVHSGPCSCSTERGSCTCRRPRSGRSSPRPRWAA